MDQAAGRRANIADLRLPPLGEQVWSAFWRIEQSRQGGFGPQAFTYLEIEAWARLVQNPLAPWEVEAIMSMDVARRAALDAGKGEERPPGLTRLVSAHSEAAERMFDRFGEVRDG